MSAAEVFRMRSHLWLMLQALDETRRAIATLEDLLILSWEVRDEREPPSEPGRIS